MQKGLTGKDKVIEVLIEELTHYFGNAIISNDTVESVKNAIIAIFYHE